MMMIFIFFFLFFRYFFFVLPYYTFGNFQFSPECRIYWAQFVSSFMHQILSTWSAHNMYPEIVKYSSLWKCIIKYIYLIKAEDMKSNSFFLLLFLSKFLYIVHNKMSAAKFSARLLWRLHTERKIKLR